MSRRWKSAKSRWPRHGFERLPDDTDLLSRERPAGRRTLLRNRVTFQSESEAMAPGYRDGKVGKPDPCSGPWQPKAEERRCAPVTRDFVRSCQTPILVLPDDVPAHPYAVAMETVRLAPKAEASIYPWKDSKDHIQQAVRHVRDFLRAHHPVTAAP